MIAASGRKASGALSVAALLLTTTVTPPEVAYSAPASATNGQARSPAKSQQTFSPAKPQAAERKQTSPASGGQKPPTKTEPSKTPAAAPSELRTEERKTAPSPALKIPPFPEPARRALSSTPEIDTSKPPPLLPRAPRERMRACAEQWIALKHKSRTGLPMWRDFAEKCLGR